MTVRVLALSLASLFLFVGCQSSGYEGPDEEVPDPTWTTDVQPILAGYCDACHEGDAAGSGGHGWLNSYEDVIAVAEAASCEGETRGECIPGRIVRGEMPLGAPCTPGDEGCITALQLQTVENWIAADMPE
jgi:hypothetical protein